MKTRLFWLSAVFVLASAMAIWASPAKDPGKDKGKTRERIQWSLLDTSAMGLEESLGSLMSCTYRLLAPGKSFEYVHQERLKIVAIKSEKDEVTTTIFINKAKQMVDKPFVEEAISEAVQACFEAIADREPAPED